MPVLDQGGPRLMSWVWSDDLAALLVERGEADAAEVADWSQRPQGFAVSEGVTPVDFARELLAMEQERDPLRRVS